MIISFFRNKSAIFFLFLLLFLTNQLICITDVRPVMYDESWYASTGYNMAKGLGIRNTIVGSGGDVNFVFPLFNAFFFKLFGYNLTSIRHTAVFFGLITIIAIYSFLKKNNFDNRSTFLTLFIFSSLTLFNTVFRFGRPECASLAFLSIGIIAFGAFLSERSYKSIIILSLSALLSGLSHPFTLLPYCIMGTLLVINDARSHNLKQDFLKLLIFLCSGLAVIITLYCLSSDSSGITERYSLSNIKNSIPFYLKESFLSRQVIVTVPTLAIIISQLFGKRNKLSKYLSITALAVFVIFPVLFTTDIMMVGLGLDYVAIISIFVFPFLIKDITQNLHKSRFLLIGISLFCAANIAISYYYNFAVKYEKVNSILSKEMNEIIPEGANVFGAIRLWPFAMNTMYISDHYRLELPDYDGLDYIITSSQDIDRYSSYNKYKPYLMEGNIVYSKETRQYGTVNVYKCK